MMMMMTMMMGGRRSAARRAAFLGGERAVGVAVPDRFPYGEEKVGGPPPPGEALLFRVRRHGSPRPVVVRRGRAANTSAMATSWPAGDRAPAGLRTCALGGLIGSLWPAPHQRHLPATQPAM
jgi:hypothetical protein